MYVGKRLAARSEPGWGWTLRTQDGLEPEENPKIVSSDFSVIPVEFFPESGCLRGFVGRVCEETFPLHDSRVVAFTMSDGCCFDFEANICFAWRFLFGDGELDLTDLNRPTVNGIDILAGYGSVAKNRDLFGAKCSRPN
jgi:hypothetical protein